MVTAAAAASTNDTDRFASFDVAPWQWGGFIAPDRSQW